MPTFRELHHGAAPFLLPNAWDAGSALAFAKAGFTAIGTTSFGVAASQGMPDGAGLCRAATLALVGQLSRLGVHISADIEDGYSADSSEVAGFVAQLAELGVAGVNLEDSSDGHLVDPAVAADKIAAVKRVRPDVFVNARVDNLWFGEQASVEAVLARARLYTDAGADGIFIPGLSTAADIRVIAVALDLPLNVLPHPTLTVAELGTLGVRRVSTGSLPYRAAVDAGVNAALDLRDGRTPPAATPYWDMQAWLLDFNQR
ncbi:2-methylisocitrate lyase-like PEP mutase family enzyme [Arthrobacter stackebrandtii]|uniref:2-methylisocitrate lyase-like PEP mutase family enzyme n=1 Tax=Arthrobacter stackebrandtii TaxID=272161 RepID=A0ABS4YT28_9MICC|nr:2-methylisocitrate lyase-like PEP mutase family enzyme [Arthrobacter stackebrandtii]PYG99788.1 isocitrate lyase/phosphoenolpyruvate mutase family protein [Arthrobacter stackebrandtii]